MPGLWAIAVPIPDSPIRYGFAYALVADDGLILVDTGWDSELAMSALTAGLAMVGNRLADLSAILVSHMHPDHFGLIPRLLDAAPNAWVGMHADDVVLVLADDGGLRVERERSWAGLMGTVGAPEKLELAVRTATVPRLRARHAARVRVLADGERIRSGMWDLEAIWTPGHTPGHLMFLEHSSRLLFSGDHVLPTVTPHITQQVRADQDPLGDYLESLRSTLTMQVEQVLPGHQYRFRGLSDRVEALLHHHSVRLDVLEAAVRSNPGATCYELTSAITWARPFAQLEHKQMKMAIKETLVHLTHLSALGRVVGRPGDPATTWFGA